MEEWLKIAALQQTNYISAVIAFAAFQTPSPNEYNIQQGQTRHGRFTGPQASLKGRASPYLYSGFSDPRRVHAVKI